jgi:PEGA domain-containing protein
MEGYIPEQITLTEGPFEWVAFTGRHHGTYFLLRSNHFNIKLEPISYGAGGPVETIGHEGPLHPTAATSFRADDRPQKRSSDPSFGTVKIESDPPGADIYVDGNFVGQTPSSLQLSSGRHHIDVRLPGRQTWERDLEVMRDSQLTLHPVLAQSP